MNSKENTISPKKHYNLESVCLEISILTIMMIYANNIYKLN